MRRHLLAAFLLVITACSGDDGVNHLADAPPVRDAPADTAIDSPDPLVTLSTTLAGTGMGTVTSSPAGLSCSSGTCSADFDPDTVVTLTAVPDTGSVFGGWSGACTGTTPTCEVTLAQSASVTATFTLAQYAVTVTKSGAGTGTVMGSGIDCGSTCTMMVDHGTTISLTATPANLSVFAGWGGACSGTAGCMVTVTEPTAISASFPLDTITLFVTKGGNGAGTVTATGITCGADCDETYTAGQMVTLTAAAATGSTFTGWSGAGCSGTSTCTVTMTAATTVTATFTLQQFALTVTRAGTGSGNVVSTPAGIACGADCTETYDYNTMVTLTATPSTGSTFTGWSGACTGTAMCIVTLSQARNVTATFTLMQMSLTASVTGNGTVTSSPAGITCPSDCTESYSFGQGVTLTATAGTGSTFAGWSGACSGTGACTVTMDASKAVSASFTLNTYALSVATAGNGTGTVTGTGISCGSDCSESYLFGTMVTLTAAPATGSAFMGWSGACSGTGACTVTIDAAKSVTATFVLQTFTLTAARAGNGSGSITSAPAGITCGSDCTESYAYNTSVTLTAAAATGSTFTGWSGACTGTGACTVTMTQARSVTATFTLMQFPLMVTVAGSGTGTVTSAPAGITCGMDCMENIDYGTMVTLTATAASGSTFAGWTGGGCTGTAQCVVTVDAAKTVTATFTLMLALDVTKAGMGTGTVTSMPAGISCGSTCSQNIEYGTMVTLTATPTPSSSTFAGWSGACTGTGTCTVTMTQARSVTATFDVATYALTVTRAGTGGGTVASMPSGINCPGTCSATYNHNTSVTLTATEDATSNFAGWSGACTGTGTCTVTMSQARDVTATFNTKTFKLTVTRSGDGGGTVTGNGVDCGTSCQVTLTIGTVVTLTATPATSVSKASTFKGWNGGGCTATGSCTFTINADTTVDAAFKLNPNLMFVTSAVYNGNLGGLAGADAKCQGLANAAGLSGSYRAYLGSTGIPAASRFPDASGWTRVDGSPIVNAIADFGVVTLTSSPSLDERGTDVTASGTVGVWTGTFTDGSPGPNCNNGGLAPDWSSTTVAAIYGMCNATTSSVTTVRTASCSGSLRLYCFGNDRAATVP